MPSPCAAHGVEVARWEWRLTDGGDPAELVAKFLAEYGLGTSLSGSGGDPHGDLCGAAVFVSAAAGAQMITSIRFPPSPTPSVPDAVAVVYGRGRARMSISEVSGRSGPVARLGDWSPSWSPAEHAAAVEAVRSAIARGDVYQVNVVGHASASFSGDPVPALARVAALPGARYAGVLRGYGWTIGSASPETLLEVRGGVVVTRPIKGTRPATVAGYEELRVSAKERAEHIMIVDLERNDLSHVAATGTVRVDDLFAVRRWCDLWQAESEVSARLAEGVGLADVLRAVCPGGSVTGAPKLAALELIARLEPVGRGASMGGLGWVGPDWLDLGLTIRTVAVADGRVHVWAGGGITWDSEPWAEVAEAAAKSDPVRAALAGL